jgi:hypothetical protein
MAQTMAMGQAAGLAASLSLETDTAAMSLDISELQKRLVQDGTILDRPDKQADTTRNGWMNNIKQDARIV